MMQQHILFPDNFKNVCVWRQGRVAHRLEKTVFQFREGIVYDQRHQMRHREGAVDLVKIGFAQVEKFEEQFPKIFWAIGLYFETHSIATARPAQLIFDTAQEIFRFFIVDIKIAVSGHAKGVHAFEN